MTAATYDFKAIYDRRGDGSKKWACLPATINPLESAIYPLTVADLDFALAPEIREALQAYVGEHVLGYTLPTAQYLQAVCQFIKTHYAYQPSAADITTTPGIVSALAAAVRAFTKVNEAVLIFTPIYPPFYRVVEGQGRKLVELPLDVQQTAAGQRFKIDFSKLASLLAKEKVKLILLCSPHNPTGRVWEFAELRELAVLAKAHNCLVISDEIHADLTHSNKRHYLYFEALVAEQLVVSEEAAIVCTSASKAFNIAGLQCSNILIANPEIRARFQNELLVSGLQAANALGLVATQAAYTQAEAWRQAMLEVIEANYLYVCEFFKNWDSRFQVFATDASYLAWVDCSAFACKTCQFTEAIMAAQFFVAPGIDFGKNGAACFRLNFGLPSEQLKACLAGFKERFSPFLAKCGH